MAEDDLGPIGTMLDRVLVERCRRLTHDAPPRVPSLGWGEGEPLATSRAVAGQAAFRAWVAARVRDELADVRADAEARADREARWRACEEGVAQGLMRAREGQLGELAVTADLLASATVRWERASSRFTVESSRVFACLRGSCAGAAIVLPSLEPRCHGSSAPCRLKLLALERLLQIVVDPTPSEAEAYAHLVAAEWQQLFDRLRHVASDTPRPRIGWVLKSETELALCRIEPKADGGWKAKALSPDELAEAELSDANDALVAALASHALPAYERPQLHADRLARMLAALVGREVFAKRERELVPFLVERVDPRIEVVDQRPAVRWGEQLVPARALPSAGSWAHMIDASARVIRVGFWSRAAVSAWKVLADAPVVPDEGLPALADTLLEVAKKVPVKRDQRWLGEGHAPALDVVFRLAFEGPRSARRLLVEGRVRPLPELGALLPGYGEPIVAVRKNGRVGHVVRAFDAERAAVDAVAIAVGLVIDHEADGPARFDWTLAGLDAAMPVWQALQAQAAANPTLLHLEWQAAVPIVHLAKTSQLQMRMGVRRDWLDLDGGLGLDGAELPLRELLLALRDKKRWLALADGHIVALDETLRRELAPLEAVERDGERLRTSIANAPIAEALAAAGAQVEGTPEWLAVHDRLREAATLMIGIPTNLRATLRPYQADGFTWLARLGHWARGACLADDMGLGKTLQALALLLHRGGRGLVVAPTSVVPNWLRESARFAPSLDVEAITRGSDIDRLDGDATIVTSWDLLVRHESRFAAVRWATVILDEAHAVKNPATQRARVARGLNADFIVALTGTPLENRPAELWSLFQVIAPGLLGSAEAFREAYGRQIELQQPEPAARLSRLIRPFLLRRRKAEVAGDLPSRSEVRVDVVLTPDERERYERVRRAAMAELKRRDRDHNINGVQSALRVLAVLMRLRQLACHPRLVDPSAPETSAKLDRLLELVNELRQEGRKVLVFSQFTELLALVRAAFDADGIHYAYLDGTTPSEHRIAEVDRFQSGAVDAFLLSLKAGGSGLNLTTASEVIHLDPWWNPAAEDQASDRAHRIGQSRPVTIYRMVTQGTIEEQIQGLQHDKRAMVASVLEGTSATDALTVDTLVALIADESAWRARE